MADDKVRIAPGTSFRVGLIVAIAADIVQLAALPLLWDGALSPADDLIDLGVGAFLTYLLGWQWEFLPSFLGKLVPGVDLVPFWTLAVANVYRKKKRLAVSEGALRDQQTQDDTANG